MPASTAASMASPVASSRSRAKLTTRIELAVATPMHMMAPVSAGTESVVPVPNSIHMMPASAAGRGGDDHEGIEPGLEIHHDQQIDQDDRGEQSEGQSGERRVHRHDLAAQMHRHALGQVARRVGDGLAHVGRDRAQGRGPASSHRGSMVGCTL